jgi:endonuclease V-like protein UPF0215 family
VGIVYRLDHRIEGILSTKIRVDGLNATEKLIKLYKNCKFKPQIRYIMLSGINFAGFNFADLPRLAEELKTPVIAVFRKKPRMEKIKRALKKLTQTKKRTTLLEKAGEIHSFNKIYFQCHGVDAKHARTIIKKTTLHSNLPEPVRLAHLIASGVTIGQSTTTL